MWEKFKYFKPLDIDLSKEYGCKVIGCFGYEIAMIANDSNSPKIPREVMNKFEWACHEGGAPMANKMVYICEDTNRFGTENFAVQLKDSFARIGKWKHVTSYGVGPLELK